MTNPIWLQSQHKKRLLAGLLLTLCNGIVPPTGTLAREETVGEHFRKVIGQIDAECRKEKVGPYLDPKDPQYNDKKRYTHCDILKLKPHDPLATEEGRFAHSIKLPPPHDKPKEVYKPGMTGEEYFKALCEVEGGEWVFRTGENAEGVLQMRPHVPEHNGLGHLFAFESLGGLLTANYDRPQGYLIRPPLGRLRFVEAIPDPSNTTKGVPKYKRFVYGRNSDSSSSDFSITEESVPSLQSQYGYTQRGIRRAHDLELGVRGSELILMDLNTKEVIGFRRVFIRYYFDLAYRDARTVFQEYCPKGTGTATEGFQFILNVLKPINQ